VQAAVDAGVVSGATAATVTAAANAVYFPARTYQNILGACTATSLKTSGPP
jgi:hypothetical protein